LCDKINIIPQKKEMQKNGLSKMQKRTSNSADGVGNKSQEKTSWGSLLAVLRLDARHGIVDRPYFANVDYHHF